MARKRRTTEVFSLSFLDCICCGFGAMLLLFVLTIGRNADAKESIVSDIKSIISKLEKDISTADEEKGRIQRQLAMREQQLSIDIATLDTTKHNLTELKDRLALLLQQRSSLKEEKEKLLAEKKEIPKQDEEVPIPIPNVQRRQYLTGVNFEGNYMLIMVEASGGMVADTVDEAIQMLSRPDEEKRKAVKWRRVIRSVQWIIANLTPKQAYQVLIFNAEAKPLLANSEHDWFEPLDRKRTSEVLKALEQVTPHGGANLERAFSTVREMFPSTDSILLLTDGLPTQSDSYAPGDSTDDRERERLFRAALRMVPRQTPINTILFPMSGDPAAPFLFWQLADSSNGSLVCPAASWPDI